MANDVEYFPIYLLSVCIFSLKTSIHSDHLPILKLSYVSLTTELLREFFMYFLYLELQGDPTSHPKGDQSWVCIGRTDAEAETPILWPHHVKS